MSKGANLDERIGQPFYWVDGFSQEQRVLRQASESP